MDARVEQELLPGLPDELVLQRVMPLLPYYTRALASTLSSRWRQTLLRHEADPLQQQRCRRAFRRHSGLLLRLGPSCRLSFLDFSDTCLHPLPPPPFAHRGLGAMFTFVFSVNHHIFAAQRSSHASLRLGPPLVIIKRLFMLDIGAGLFHWQQRFGPTSQLHCPHIGDMRGCIEVSSPSQCAIIGSKVYVIAQRLPPSIKCLHMPHQAIHFYTKFGRGGVGAAVYNACEDVWEEIPSPLGGSFTTFLVDLHPGQAGVVATLCDKERRTTSLAFFHADKLWYDTERVTDDMCAGFVRLCQVVSSLPCKCRS